MPISAILQRLLARQQLHSQRTLPEVLVTLSDLELERRAETPASILAAMESPPLGIEFSFNARNQAGQIVCTGKFDYIAGLQITVQLLDTDLRHRRRRYATAALVQISERLGGLPIAPMLETGEAGKAFWRSLRERPVPGLHILEEIGRSEASLLISRAETVARIAASATALLSSKVK